MEKILNLLSQVAIIHKKNEEILDASGGRFNIFRVCGVNHYENTHSAILAEFLNPHSTHGLKSELLKSFIETLGDYFTVQNFNFENSRVRTEHATEEGRIDILIEDNQLNVIIIENKIYARDQPEQLKRYERYAKANKRSHQILYLTLYGESASKQSAEDVLYLSISYNDTIIKWLEKCVGIAGRFPMVRETIFQYINHLKELTNQDMNVKNKEEILEVLANFGNLRAAKVIEQNYKSTFAYLASKHFNPAMKTFANEKGLEYEFQESAEEYIQFKLTSTTWQSNLWIAFTFEDNRFFYGICNNLSIYKMTQESRKTLHENLKEIGVNSCKESPYWPFYAYLTNLSIDKWESEIVNSDIFLNDCKEKINKLLHAVEDTQI